MGCPANCQAFGIGKVAVKKLTAEELKKLLLVKNVVSAVPHTDETAEDEETIDDFDENDDVCGMMIKQ